MRRNLYEEGDTGSIGGFPANGFVQAQIDGHSNSHSEQGAEELPGREAKENGFLVLAYFLGNHNFQTHHPFGLEFWEI